MTTATKPEIVKLAPNLPVEIRIKYADMVEGQYGDQIRLKGESPTGQTIAIYVPVGNSADLIQAGAKQEQNQKGVYYTLPKSVDWWVVEKKQGAGEKYGHVTLTPKGTTVPQPAKGPAPSTSPQQSETPALVELYDDTLRHIVRIVGAVNSQKDPAVVFTGTDAAAMCATLFIARSKAL